MSEQDGMRKLSAATVCRWGTKVLLGFNTKKGGWEFGGGKNQGNERIMQTARRELYEEVGWDTSWMKLERIGDYENDPGWYCVLFQLTFREDPPPLPSSPPEPQFSEWRWFEISELEGIGVRSNCRSILRTLGLLNC